MALWRCNAEECADDSHGRLGFDFVADVPVCPKCGADRRRPAEQHIVSRREVLHLIAKDRKGPIVGARGRFKIACSPQKPLGGGTMGTGSALDCNCEACKATPEYAGLYEEATGQVYAAADFSVSVDPKEQTITRA